MRINRELLWKFILVLSTAYLKNSFRYLAWNPRGTTGRKNNNLNNCHSDSWVRRGRDPLSALFQYKLCVYYKFTVYHKMDIVIVSVDYLSKSSGVSKMFVDFSWRWKIGKQPFHLIVKTAVGQRFYKTGDNFKNNLSWCMTTEEIKLK